DGTSCWLSKSGRDSVCIMAVDIGPPAISVCSIEIILIDARMQGGGRPNGCVRPVHSCCEWLPVECAAAVQNASYRKAQHSDIRTRRRISGSLSLFDILIADNRYI